MWHTNIPGRHVRAPALGAALLALAACGGPSGQITLEGEPVRAAPPAGRPLPVLALPSAPPTLPGAPLAREGGAAIGNALARTFVGGAAGMFACLAAAPGSRDGAWLAILCLPIGLVVGATAGAAGSASDWSQSPATEAEALRRVEVLVRRLQTERLSACLRDTLVARSSGRLAPAAGNEPEPLRVGMREIRVTATESLFQPPSNPDLALVITVASEAGAKSFGPGPERRITWNGPTSSYAAWTENDGALLEEQIGIAIGRIAREMLAELFGGAEFPAPRSASARLAERASCPPPPPTALPAVSMVVRIAQ